MRITVLLVALLLSACATPVKYTARPDISDALKQNMKGGVNVGEFKAPEDFNRMCRMSSLIYPPDYTMTFEGYIQNALAEELKAVGKFNDQNAKVLLSGSIEKLAFSTTANGLTGGTWDIGLRVNSSNGRSVFVSEHYVFDASSMAVVACQQATDAFLPALQNLISKLVRSSEFPALVASGETLALAKDGAAPAKKDRLPRSKKK